MIRKEKCVCVYFRLLLRLKRVRRKLWSECAWLCNDTFKTHFCLIIERWTELPPCSKYKYIFVYTIEHIQQHNCCLSFYGLHFYTAKCHFTSVLNAHFFRFDCFFCRRHGKPWCNSKFILSAWLQTNIGILIALKTISMC